MNHTLTCEMLRRVCYTYVMIDWRNALECTSTQVENPKPTQDTFIEKG
jgi:hypothetical protein